MQKANFSLARFYISIMLNIEKFLTKTIISNKR